MAVRDEDYSDAIGRNMRAAWLQIKKAQTRMWSQWMTVGEGLMEGRTGQFVMREIVEDYLSYVTWADDDYPSMLQFRSCQPSKVVMDPYRLFGQPFFDSTRVRVGDVADMLSMGEDPQVVAEEYGIGIEEVRTAARILLGIAA